MGSIKRKYVQFLATIGTNSYFKGFAEGNIYKGPIKNVCVPGLNCYSCPGAIGSCPIGSLQAVTGGIRFSFPFYILGILALFGLVLGRFVCGWLCPFGYIQELLYKIPSPKFKVPKYLGFLKYAKYLILVVFVFLLPMFFVNDVGLGDPFFCKYICPAGTLEGGIPLVLMNESLRSTIGFLYAWKVSLLVITIILSIIVFRPFCRFICPLGAIYALFNPISIYRFEIDDHKCTKCGLCAKKCKLDVDVYKHPNSLECIRCGECVKACPQKAIKTTFALKSNEKNIKDLEVQH